MNRFFNWLKALFNRTMDRVEDPDMMLDQARRDMQQVLIANKERAIQAMTQKNRLELMLADERKKAEKLEQQAALALKQGDRETATMFMREKMNHDATITSLQQSYEQALQTVEQVKVAVRRQEEEVRKKHAEALQLKAQWKQAQIQSSISKALEGLTFENQFGGFGAAQERIREAQSEASARQEMLGTSLQGKMMTLEDKARDYEAEAELSRLEEKLGMRPAATTEAAQTVQVGAAPGTPNPDASVEAAAQSEAERQIEELERRLKNS